MGSEPSLVVFYFKTKGYSSDEHLMLNTSRVTQLEIDQEILGLMTYSHCMGTGQGQVQGTGPAK